MEERKTAAERLDAAINVAIVRGIVTNKKQFAQLLNIRPELLSRYTTGAKEVPPQMLSRVNNVTGGIFSPDWLLFGEGDMLAAGDGSVQNVTNSHVNNGVPAKNFENEKGWFTLVAEKDKQIDRLLSIIERMQQS